MEYKGKFISEGCLLKTIIAVMLLGVVITVAVVFAAPLIINSTSNLNIANQSPDACHPLVIAHRGASGYVPEHTLASYALAATLGADYVEPDLVMTKDGHLIARHDNELSLTTDVATHSEYASRYRTQLVDGREISGWFTEDFTLAEIKTLRAIERIPNIRPGNARLNRALEIPTLQEIVDLVKGLEISLHRTIGIYPEIKHSTYFKELGLAMEKAVVDTLHENGYKDPESPIYIQSLEINGLKEMKKYTRLRLIQLYASISSDQPFDQRHEGSNLTYADLATADGLKEVSTYAHAVGPDKNYIIPRNSNNNLGTVTSFVAHAHAAGLKVHPYTFRAENSFLPNEFRSLDPSDAAIGDLNGELKAFFDAGIDGLFADQPDIPFRLRGPNACL